MTKCPKRETRRLFDQEHQWKHLEITKEMNIFYSLQICEDCGDTRLKQFKEKE